MKPILIHVLGNEKGLSKEEITDRLRMLADLSCPGIKWGQHIQRGGQEKVGSTRLPSTGTRQISCG